MFYRDSWVEVDLDALKHNITCLKEKSKKKLIAVIKANGYGCGDTMIASTAIKAGADMLAVSSLEEAIALRDHGIDADILILGYVNPKLASLLIQYNLITTVVSKKWAEELVQNSPQGCRVHLKADTGMNRIGIKDYLQMQEVLNILLSGGVRVEGIFTHMACADEEDNENNKQQLDCFKAFLTHLDYHFEWIHFANSDSTVHFDDDCANAVRCGLAIYGLTSYQDQLIPVLSLKSKISHCKLIEANEKVGYSFSYTALQPEWIATIPIGYADGWWRKNQGRKVYINNQYYELVGRICMDQCMIKVSENIHVDDIVELIGPHMPLDQVAKELDTIPYEVMSSLSDRLNRIYISQGQVIQAYNYRFKHYQTD